MSDENPYAAPQSTLQRPVVAALPVAEAAPTTIVRERRLFPRCDTVRLWLLEARSRAIADMRSIWLLLFLFGELPLAIFLYVFLGGIENYVTRTDFGLALGLMALTLLRFILGDIRTPLVRYFSLVMDGLLTAAAVLATAIGIYLLVQYFHTAPLYALGIQVSVILMLGLVGVIGWRACKGLVQTPELFAAGLYPHEQLLAEAEYRRLNHIP